MNSFKLAAGLALIGSLIAVTAAKADIIFSNQNGNSVTQRTSGPPTATQFTLATSDYITLIDVYNHAFTDGMPTAYQISITITNSSNVIVSTSTAVYSTFFASSILGAPNLQSFPANPLYPHYQSNPDVQLAAGTYTITEDTISKSGWSYNTASGYAGFATVGDGPVPAPEPVSMALLGSGIAGLALSRRRKQGKA